MMKCLLLMLGGVLCCSATDWTSSVPVLMEWERESGRNLLLEDCKDCDDDLIQSFKKLSPPPTRNKAAVKVPQKSVEQIIADYKFCAARHGEAECVRLIKTFPETTMAPPETTMKPEDSSCGEHGCHQDGEEGKMRWTAEKGKKRKTRSSDRPKRIMDCRTAKLNDGYCRIRDENDETIAWKKMDNLSLYMKPNEEESKETDRQVHEDFHQDVKRLSKAPESRVGLLAYMEDGLPMIREVILTDDEIVMVGDGEPWRGNLKMSNMKVIDAKTGNTLAPSVKRLVRKPAIVKKKKINENITRVSKSAPKIVLPQERIGKFQVVKVPTIKIVNVDGEKFNRKIQDKLAEIRRQLEI